MRNVLIFGLTMLNRKAIETEWTLYEPAPNEGKEICKYNYTMEAVVEYLQRVKRVQIDNIVALATKKSLESGALTYLQEKYPNIDIEAVDIDENEIPQGVVVGAKKLREIKATYGEYDLWVDTHGSLREMTSILQGVLSLLEKEGIVPRQPIYSCQVDTDNKTSIIDEVNDGYLIYQFVAGMNEFLNFGKGEQLCHFFHDDNKEGANIIRAISDAILLCDMDAFDKKCVELGKWLAKRNPDGSYLDLFEQYIKADYGVLLKKGKILSKIEWCLSKDYIQQALTLIESKMPARIYNSLIVATNMDEQPQCMNEKFNAVNKTISQGTVKQVITDWKNRWENRANYIVQEYAFSQILTKDNHNHFIHLNLERLKRDSQTVKFPSQFLLKKDRRNDWGVLIKMEYKKAVDTVPDFIYFMKLHMALKNQRNSANHGATGEKRYGVAVIKNAIRMYIQCAKELGLD